MTRSTGTLASMTEGSPPIRATADRIAARSTTQGTPVKSCSSTRAGMNANSGRSAEVASQSRRASTSLSSTTPWPQWRRPFSRSTRMEYGSLPKSRPVAAASCRSPAIRAAPPGRSRVFQASNGLPAPPTAAFAAAALVSITITPLL